MNNKTLHTLVGRSIAKDDLELLQPGMQVMMETPREVVSSAHLLWLAEVVRVAAGQILLDVVDSSEGIPARSWRWSMRTNKRVKHAHCRTRLHWLRGEEP